MPQTRHTSGDLVYVAANTFILSSRDYTYTIRKEAGAPPEDEEALVLYYFQSHSAARIKSTDYGRPETLRLPRFSTGYELHPPNKYYYYT